MAMQQGGWCTQRSTAGGVSCDPTCHVMAVPHRRPLGGHAVRCGDALELPHHGHAALQHVATNQQQHLQQQTDKPHNDCEERYAMLHPLAGAACMSCT
jgi:hypothetical protein